MDEEFWHRKWQRGEIAFHEADINPLLLRHFAALGLPPGARILVPLCGKSRDMHWLLAQGHAVVGAELSRLAIEQLFADLGLVPAVAAQGPLERFEAGRLTVLVGNIFDLDHTALGRVDGVYDRAALVALPEPMRTRYAAHLAAVSRHAPQLLVTLDYDPAAAIGPPFAVTEHDVRRYYGAAYHVTCAELRDLPGGLKGVKPAREAAWRLLPR